MAEGAYVYGFQVRLHDTDAAGVLFFAHLLRHAHDAYEALMAEAGFPLQGLIRGGMALPIVHAEADFQAPMRQGDRIRVEVTLAEVRRRSFSLDYRFLDPNGAQRARARTVHVLSHGSETGTGTLVLPSALRAALSRWQGPRGPEPGGHPPSC